MQEKKCTNCGEANAETAEFCKSCGSSFEKEEPQKVSTDEITSEEPSSPEVKNDIILNKLEVIPEDHPDLEDQARHAETENKSSKPEIPRKIGKGGTSDFDINSNSARKASFILQVIPPFSSLIITIAFLNYIATSFNYTSILYQLFLPAGGLLQKAVPFVILFMFFWSLADILIKIIRARRQNKHIQSDELLEIPNKVQSKGVRDVLQKFKLLDDKIKNGLAFRRIHSLLAHLKSTDNPQRSHESFRHQNDIDSDNANASYSTVRIFIWAMPILGFIGTVVGISLAVGNFSQFLTGDIDNIERVKGELSKVATGLSFAFNTTLLGLVASLIAMLLTSYVQRRDEGFLTRLEELGLNIIANFRIERPTVAAERSTDSLVDTLEHSISVLNIQTKNLAASIEDYTSSFEDSSMRLSKSFSELPGKIEKYQEYFANELKTLLENISTNIESYVTTFKGISDKVSDIFSELPGKFEEHQGSLRSDLNSVFESVSTSISQLITRFDEIAHSMGKEFSVIPARMQENEIAFKSTLDKLTEYNQQLDTTFKNSTNQFLMSSELLASKVEDIQPTQNITMQAIDSLNSFNQLLKEMQEIQNRLIPLLQNLSGPLEFKLVPSQAKPLDSQRTDGA